MEVVGEEHQQWEHKVMLVLKELLVLKVHKVIKDPLVREDLQVHKEHKVLKELLELKGLKDIRDRVELEDPQVLKEQ